LDKDNLGEIDFEKFCHLNYDKTKDSHNYINELKRKFGEELNDNQRTSKGKGMKPPLP
jgi:hypothetical protein